MTETLPILEQALEKQKRILGLDHPDTLKTMNNLAATYQAAGKYELALPLLEETLLKLKARLGPDHYYTLSSMHNLAFAYQASGRQNDAEPLFREALVGTRLKFGIAHSRTQTILQSLIGCYGDLRQPEKAEPLWRELAAFWKEQAGAGSQPYSWKLVSLALNLREQKRPADAEPLLREALVIYEKRETNAWTTLQCRSFLADSLLEQKKYADAEPLLVSAYEEMQHRAAKIAGADAPGSYYIQRRIETLEQLIRIAEATNQSENLEENGRPRKQNCRTDLPPAASIRKAMTGRHVPGRRRFGRARLREWRRSPGAAGVRSSHKKHPAGQSFGDSHIFPNAAVLDGSTHIGELRE